MLNQELNLNHEIFTREVEKKSIRDAFGEALLHLGDTYENVVVLSADLGESTRTHHFSNKFPTRFIQMGISEQNMAGVAAGLALSGKIPYITSHATFSPSRNWDQIRVSICMNRANVKIIGSHAGFTYGRDGATANALEDIAIMRALPNIVILNPIDYDQTLKAIEISAKYEGPMYIRLAKENTPLITTLETTFELGKAQVLIEGSDATIISTGPIIYEALIAAKELQTKHAVSCEVISIPTLKPIDEETILKSVRKTRNIITLEEHQLNGGLGSAVSEILSEKLSHESTFKFKRIGVRNTFTESGSYQELKQKYKIDYHETVNETLLLVKK